MFSNFLTSQAKYYDREYFKPYNTYKEMIIDQ